MKISNLTQLSEFQSGRVATPDETAVDIQQLGSVNAQPNKAGLVQHLGTITALLNKDAVETQQKKDAAETQRDIAGTAESPTQINLAMVTK